MVRRLLIVGALALLALSAGCTAKEMEPAKVTFMAGFKAQANLPFVAAYVAQEKGFFREQGLEVEIQHSSGQGEHYKLLATEAIQFTTAPAEDVLKLRADPGLPIVAIALFGQRGNRAFAALKRSGITSPKQWEGKTVGYKVFITPDYLAILKAAGVDRSKIKEVNVGFDPRVLVQGQVDVYPVFVSNEPNLIQKTGYEVTLFKAEDFGVPALGLTYITYSNLLQTKLGEDRVERFLKATLKGVYYARDNPEEAVDIVLKHAPGADRNHQRFMLDQELDMAFTDLTSKNGVGWMTKGQWLGLHDMLVQYQALAKPVPPDDAFNTSYLERIYHSGKLRWP